MRNGFFVGLLAASLALAAVPAQAYTLTCTITNGVSKTFRIPDKMVFEVDSEQLSAKVTDAISESIGQAPVYAEIDADSANKLVMVWTLEGFTYSGAISNGAAIRKSTLYRAAFFRKTGQFTLLANSVRWQPGEIGRGRCVRS